MNFFPIKMLVWLDQACLMKLTLEEVTHHYPFLKKKYTEILFREKFINILLKKDLISGI